MQTNSGKITSDDINSKENENESFRYSDGLKIYYYVTSFFYWKNLPDFTEYQGVGMIPKQKLYRYDDQNKRKKVGEDFVNNAGMIDRNYYAIEGVHKEGEIVGQTVAAGKKYDQSNPGNTILKIKVIGKVLNYEGKTAEQFINELEVKGIHDYFVETNSGEAGDVRWEISEVKIYSSDQDKDNPIDYFGKEEIKNGVYFEIVVKEPTKETPSTSASSNRSSGSYSAPTSGYDNSGSYNAPSSGDNGSYDKLSSDAGRSDNFDDAEVNWVDGTGEVSGRSAKSKNEATANNSNNNSGYWNGASTSNMEEWGFAQ